MSEITTPTKAKLKKWLADELPKIHTREDDKEGAE
jgi:hypothetical protein